MSYKIIPISQTFIPEVIKFTDQQIGLGYYTRQDLEEIVSLCQNQSNHPVSFLLVDSSQDNKILGIRLTLPPGKWLGTARFSTLPEKWQVPPDEVGYFKSLFLSPSIQGQGLGSQLSSRSLNNLKKLGAKAVVCHAWIESPGNSSRKYLLKMGFQEVGTHANFWSHIDYLCSGCQSNPCRCSAAEMILYLKDSPS